MARFMQQDSHIAQFTWQGQILWAKGVPKNKQILWSCGKKRLLGWFLPAWMRPAAPCGVRAIDVERQRLDLFARKGIPVPRVVDAAPDLLVLTHGGASFESHFKKASPQGRLALWRKALAAMAHLHAQGLAHGRAFLKDMTWRGPDEPLGFIDLAEDPTGSMTLVQAQARDWLLFLFSTLPLLTTSQQKQLMQDVWQQAPQATRFHIVQAMDGAHWVGSVPGLEKTGTDGQRLYLLCKVWGGLKR
jgi:tRNA A-37 threonylcarbamoyl transferase component Bud32